MKSYRIPQQTSIDEPIFGSFTLRQAVYLLTFGSLGYVLVMIRLWLPLKVAGICLCLVSGWAFTSLKPRGRSLESWLINYVAFRLSPKERIWRETTAFEKKRKKSRLLTLLERLSKPLASKLKQTLRPRTGAYSVSSLHSVQAEDDLEILSDVEEQVKAILRSFFAQEWSRRLKVNPSLKRAGISTLLVILEEFIGKSLAEKEKIERQIRDVA